jgi:predicted O-methyltransferase YrrM
MLAQVKRVGAAPAGIDMAARQMRAFFEENCRLMASARFPKDRDNQFRYYSNNMVFPLGDALVLRTMIHVLRPRRIIEIGSGFSTACMLDTVNELSVRPKITCIEPYPERLRSLLRTANEVEIMETPVQKVPQSRFAELGSGDILFIDSTHVMKSGSDVHYELFEILPSLRAGVVVHFHDLPYPFEYPLQWVFKDNYSWNEAYAVRAFLMYNDHFSPFYSNSFIAMHERALVNELYPDFPDNPGTSLWIRKTA